MSLAVVKAGGRIPLHPFFINILKYFRLAPIQLTLNFWMLITNMLVLYLSVNKTPPFPRIIHFLYQLKCTNEVGFYYLSKWSGSESDLVFGVRSNYKPYKDKFFFINDLGIWGRYTDIHAPLVP